MSNVPVTAAAVLFTGSFIGAMLVAINAKSELLLIGIPTGMLLLGMGAMAIAASFTKTTRD